MTATNPSILPPTILLVARCLAREFPDISADEGVDAGVVAVAVAVVVVVVVVVVVTALLVISIKSKINFPSGTKFVIVRVCHPTPQRERLPTGKRAAAGIDP